MHSQPELPALHRDPGPMHAAHRSCHWTSTGTGTGYGGEPVVECQEQAAFGLFGNGLIDVEGGNV